MLVTTKDPALIEGLLASGWHRKGDDFFWVLPMGRA